MSKISVVGAGSVGTAVAYACAIRGSANDVALYDVDRTKVTAEVLDLEHGRQFMPVARISGGDDIAVTSGSDVVVVTAGAKQHPGQSRLDLARTNVALTRELVPQLLAASPDCLLLLVTNPVDVVTMAAQSVATVPWRRVVGSGTVLDSARLRNDLASRVGVSVANVHVVVVGEHGDSEVALWSNAQIGGAPLASWQGAGLASAGGGIDPQILTELARGTTRAAYSIIEGKGATNLAIGVSSARIVEAVLRDQHRVLPVSSLLTGYGPLPGAGLDGVCVSVPTLLGREGVLAQLDVPMSGEEEAAFVASARVVHEAATGLGLDPAALARRVHPG